MNAFEAAACAWLLGLTTACSGGEGDAAPKDPNTNATLGPAAGNSDAACDVPAEGAAEDASKPDRVVGTGTPESCTGAAFVAAVAQGGVITFDCGPDEVTIKR